MSDPDLGDTYQSVWTHLMRLSFTQGTIDVGGVVTRFVRTGRIGRPTVVMLHGIGGSWECFCANLPAYAEHFDVVAFDLVGAGFTSKPEQPIYEIDDYLRHTAGVMDALGIARSSFVGVSLGGWVAARFAHHFPGRTERLVICATSGLTRKTPTSGAAGASIRNDRSAASDDPTWQRVAQIFADLIKDPVKRLPDFIKVRQTVYRLPEMKASMRRILALTHDEAFARNALPDEDWRAITAPVLLVDATDDAEHFRRNTARAAGLLPNARVTEIPAVGHWAQFEDHVTFNRVSLEFLRA